MVVVGIAIALTVSPWMSFAQTTHEERLCRWSDMNTDWCRKGDIVLVTAPVSTPNISQNAESVLVGAAVALYCDMTKPLVRISDVAVVCYYLGRQRTRSTER
jgi:hypothetical protein